MGQILPEISDVSHILPFTDEELQSAEFIDGQIKLTGAQYRRFEQLCYELNGSPPKRLKMGDDELSQRVQEMTSKEIVALNGRMEGEEEFSALPYRVIGRTKADERGRFDIVFVGQNYISTWSPEMMYRYASHESRSKNPEYAARGRLLLEETQAICPYSLLAQWNAKK